MSRETRNNDVTNFVIYDANGQIFPEGAENGDAVTYHYDAVGHTVNTDLLSTQNNELNQPSDNWHNGVTHTVEYDAENRIIYGSAATESGNDEGMRFVRDAMENSVTVTTYYYGPDGQVTETTQQLPRNADEYNRMVQPNRNRLFTVPHNDIILTDEERSTMDAIP